MVEIKCLRRSIIFICLLILGINSLPGSKYYDKDIKTLVNEKNAQVIEIGKGVKIDNDTIFIKRIINTQDNTYVRYAFIRKEAGWSFSESAIKVFDDKGREYQNQAGAWSSKVWGQDGLIYYKRLKEDVNYIVLKLEWYDRRNQLIIPLTKEGEVNEN